MLSIQFKLILIAVVVWQVACLAMKYVYRELIGHVVVAAYTWFYGDIQASYGRFDRLATYLGLLVVTLPASVLVISIVDKRSVGGTTLRRKMLTLACWQLITMLVLVTSFEFGFPDMIHQFDWWVFGPPAEIYSFRNLELHRIIAWLLCTLPITWIAVRTYLRACETPSASKSRC